MSESIICKICLKPKPLENFALREKGLRRKECNSCRLDYLKKWRERNKEYCRRYKQQPEIKARHSQNQKNRYASDSVFRSKKLEANKVSIRKNWAKRCEYINEWVKQPKNRISRALRARLNHALKGIGKREKSEYFLGCSFEECRAYIENQFADGMSWSNHGEWHIDHIIPCAHFDLTEHYQQRLCFHHLNLRPIWAQDNLCKGKLLPDLYCETLAKIKDAISIRDASSVSQES